MKFYIIAAGNLNIEKLYTWYGNSKLTAHLFITKFVLVGLGITTAVTIMHGNITFTCLLQSISCQHSDVRIQ